MRAQEKLISGYVQKRPSSPVLATEAQSHLQRNARVAFSRVNCSEDGDGTVVLRGRVPSFYLKQLAQEVVRKTDGVSSIINELNVDGRDNRRA